MCIWAGYRKLLVSERGGGRGFSLGSPHPILTRCVARGTLVSTDPWGSFPLFPRGGLNRITTTTDGLRSPLVLPRRSLKPPLLSPNIAKGIFHRPWNSLGYTPLPTPLHLTTFRNASYLAKVTKGPCTRCPSCVLPSWVTLLYLISSETSVPECAKRQTR
jgi:hypothetical protein